MYKLKTHCLNSQTIIDIKIPQLWEYKQKHSLHTSDNFSISYAIVSEQVSRKTDGQLHVYMYFSC